MQRSSAAKPGCHSTHPLDAGRSRPGHGRAGLRWHSQRRQQSHSWFQQGPMSGFRTQEQDMIAEQLKSARGWRELQNLVDRHADTLGPQELADIIAMVPRLAPPGARAAALQQQQQRQRLLQAQRAQALRQQQLEAAAEQRARMEQAARERQDYERMMRQLAGMLGRQVDRLPQVDASRLADAAQALGHVGALDNQLAVNMLEACAKAKQGQLSVQGLADLLDAIATGPGGRGRPSPAVLEQLIRDVDPLSRVTSRAELAALLSALARLGYKPSQEFVDASLRQLEARQQAQLAEQQKRQQQQQQQARGPGLLQRLMGQQQGSSAGEQEDEEAAAAAEQEEANQVSAAVRALERMGYAGQAQQLRRQYLERLQERAIQRLRAKQAQEAEAQRQAQLLRQQEAEAREAERQEMRRREAERQMTAAALQAVDSAGSWQRIQQLLASLPPNLLTFSLLARMLRRLPQVLASQRSLMWKERAALQDMLENISSLLCQRLEDSPLPDPESSSAEQLQAGMCEDLTSCLEASLSLGWRDQRLLAALLVAARSYLPSYTPSQLIRTAAAFAQAGLRPSTSWLAAFDQAALQGFKGMTAGQLSELCNTFASMGHDPGNAWLLGYLAELESREGELAPEEAASCLRAAAALNPLLVQRWYAGLQTRRRQQQAQRAQQLQAPQPWLRLASAQGQGQQPQVSAQPQVPTQEASFKGTQQPPARVPAAVPSSTQPTKPPTLSSISEEELGFIDSPAPAQQQPGAGSHAPAAPSGATASAPAGDEGLRLVSESVEFDEEAVAQGADLELGLGHDNFLMEQMASVDEGASGAQQATASVAAGKDAAGVAGKGSLGSKAETSTGQPAATPQQLRALKSVLLERLELAEDAEQRMMEGVAAANARAEAAAIKTAPVRSQIATLEGDLARVLQRHEADKAALSAQARADVFAKLLPLLDNFERAAQSLPNKTEGEAAIHHRYQAIYKQTQELLRSAGIEEVPSGPGTKFSPAVHEAIMQEVHTSVPEETILQVFQKGYQVGERLLRPSLVKVSTR